MHKNFNYAVSMNRSFANTLLLLLENDPRTPRTKQGEVNISGAARLIKVKQYNLFRWCRGASADPDADNVQALTKWFDVSLQQLMGRSPIPWIDREKIREKEEDSPLKAVISDLESQDERFQQIFADLYWGLKIGIRAIGSPLADVTLKGDYSSPKKD